MAGNSSIIGALRVELGLDSAGFEAGAAKARQTAGGLEGALGGLGRAGLGMVGGLAAGTAAVALFTSQLEKAGETAQYADDLSAMATRIGITSEALQELRHAAEVNDIPVEKLDENLKSLNGTLGALRLRIGDKKIRAAFDELGIPQSTLANMKDASDLLPLIADRISKVGNQADQVQIAKKLGIADLLPMLQGGAEGIEKLREEFRGLGLELDENTVNRLAAMNEEMRVADERSKAAGRRLSTELVPALTAIKNAAADAAGALASMFSWFNRHQGTDFEISEGLKRAQASRSRADTIRNGSTLEAMIAGNVPALEMVGPGWREKYARLAEASAARIDADVERRALAAQARAEQAAAEAAAKAGAAAGGFKLTAPPGKGKKGGEVDNSPPVISFHTFVSPDGLADVRPTKLPQLDGPIVDVAGEASKALAKHRAEIAEQWRWTIQGGMQAFVYGGSKGLMQYLADQFRDRLVQRLTDGLMNIIDRLLNAGGTAGDGKGDLISTAFSVGRKFLGFANGGSFDVGGAGGIDSQLVQFRASPNERVSITKPGQSMGVQQTFILHAEGAVLAGELVDQMRQIGVAAAVHGEIGGSARAQSKLLRRSRQRLG